MYSFSFQTAVLIKDGIDINFVGDKEYRLLRLRLDGLISKWIEIKGSEQWKKGKQIVGELCEIC